MKKLVFGAFLFLSGCASSFYQHPAIDCHNNYQLKRKVTLHTKWGVRTYWSIPCDGGFWLYQRTKP